MTADMIKIDWVDIPAGFVRRGTPAAEIDELVRRHADLAIPRSWFVKEVPRTVVWVEAFRLARTPITWAQWESFCRAVGRAVLDRPDDHPVDGVHWQDAVDFCGWVSGVLDLVVRLPTETEWERAARGDDAREFPWGDEFDAGRANLDEAGLGRTTSVGSFPEGASAFGLLDMVGNVDEWTATAYAPYPGAPADVPTVESWAEDNHVTRGGGFIHHRDLARCARRHGIYPPVGGAGFRLATSTSG